MPIEACLRLLESLTKKEQEKLRCLAASILAVVEIPCQMATIVGFDIIILLTGVVNVALALVPHAE